MSKLKIKQTYIVRCGYCGDDETLLMRDANVNSSINDEDVKRIAVQYIGNKESGWCEICHKLTEKTRVAYNLEGLNS
jgi:hypothetical protein